MAEIETINRMLDNYLSYLQEAEMSRNTIRKYLADVRRFLEFCGADPDKSQVIAYKRLLQESRKPNTVNSVLQSLNRFFRWWGKPELTVKTERVCLSASLENVVSMEEYRRLAETAAQNGKKKLYLLLKTLACTGIRVGELPYITREAAEKGKNIVYNKGRYREIYLPATLCAMLLDYCAVWGISGGPIFLGRGGRPLESSGIWRTMKRLAVAAEVDPAKVYPHSLRHLFARTYLERGGNLAELADILGHACIETTRIYTLSTAAEKRARMEALGL